MKETRDSSTNFPLVVQEIYQPAVRTIFLDRYFKTYEPPHHKIDFVMWNGIPIAAIAYELHFKGRIAKEIYLNNELVEQLDLGPELRQVIFKRHNRTNFENVDMKQLQTLLI